MVSGHVLDFALVDGDAPRVAGVGDKEVGVRDQADVGGAA